VGELLSIVAAYIKRFIAYIYKNLLAILDKSVYPLKVIRPFTGILKLRFGG
jgi:hypothetical protein